MKKIAYIVPSIRQKKVFIENALMGASTNQPDLPIVDDDDDEDPRAKELDGFDVWED